MIDYRAIIWFFVIFFLGFYLGHLDQKNNHR